MTGTPLVSCIIPAYNAGPFIDAAIDSMRQQSHDRLEILVVDDGSKDDTAARVTIHTADDARVRLIRQNHGGVAAARNRGISEARGEYIAPLDADDIWLPDAVHRMLQRFEQGGERVGLVYGWFATMDESGRLDGGYSAAKLRGDVMPTLICDNFIGNASSSMIRRDVLRKVGGYQARYLQLGSQGCEDWDLNLRIAERYKFEVVEDFLIAYRKKADSLSTNTGSMIRSQQLILEDLMSRGTALPGAVRKLAVTALITHYATESVNHGHYDRARELLGEALQTSLFFSLIRPTYYRILLQTKWKRLATQSGRNDDVMPCKNGEALVGLKSGRIDLDTLRKSFAVRYTVFLHSSLHRILSVIYRPSG
jgi:glycosyltransferase involved in cell wall biosynthesis